MSAVKIGEFTIRHYPHKHCIWIGKDSGEGCEVNEAKLEALIKKFFDDNF